MRLPGARRLRASAAPTSALAIIALLAPAALVAAVLAGPAVEVLDVRLFTIALGLFFVAGAAMIIVRIDPAWTIIAGFGLTIFSGQWGNLGIPVGIDRVLLLGGVLVALHRIRSGRTPAALTMRPTHWLLVLVSVYAIGSALFAGTLLQAEPLFALADSLPIIGFLIFAVAPAIFRSARSRDLVLTLLVAVGAYLGVTAVLEQIGPSALVFPGYIADPGVGIHFGRARGPFVESAAMGLALYICGVAAAIAYRAWGGWARRCAGGTVLLCGIGIVLTLTRQVWLGAAVGTIATLLLVPGLRRLLVPVVAGSALLLGGLLLAVPSVREQVQERAADRGPVWDRLNSNRAGAQMLVERPLLGFGWYRFGEVSPGYYQQSERYPLTTVGRIHNVYLSRAVELGIIGAVLWMAALVFGVGSALLPRPGPSELEPWRIGLIAIVACWLVVANFTPLGYPFANIVLWLWAGIIVAGRESAPPAPVRRVVLPAPGGSDRDPEPALALRV